MYRFGFQGQEKDDEITGVTGSHLAYKFREYDSRVGRFFAVDPLMSKYPQWSPYQFSGNQVISTIELEGLEPLEDINEYGKIMDDYEAYKTSGASSYQEYKDNSDNNGSSPSMSAQEILAGGRTWSADDQIYTQVTSNTLVVRGQGGKDVPEYKFVLPQNLGSFSQAGSDGLIWTGCMSCHAINGAFTYASHNSDEMLWGKAAAFAVMVGFVGVEFAMTPKPKLSSVQSNRAVGNAFRDELAAGLAAEGRTVSTEVYKKTPFGARYIDIEVGMGGKVFGGIETKVGSSRYYPLQKIKDIWLDANTTGGYPVQLVRKP